MSKALTDLLARRVSLLAQLEKCNKQIAQASFVDSLAPGAYVHGALNDGTPFKHAKVLGKTEALGTSGVWYKLRLNEDSAEEEVKSVRLSNIAGVEGARS